MDLTAHRCPKQKRPNQSQDTNFPPSPCPSDLLPWPPSQWLAPPAPNTQTGCQPRLFLPHPGTGHFQNSSRGSLPLLPPLLLRPPSLSLNYSTRNLLTGSWLAFSPAPTPPQHCCQSNLSKTKSDYVTSLFRIFVSRIKCKILPRTYKVLYYLASDYLPLLRPRSWPTQLTQGKRSNLEVPKQCFSVCPECNSLICPSGKLPLIFSDQLKIQNSACFSLGFRHVLHLSLFWHLIQPNTNICLYVCLSHKTRNPLGLCVLRISVSCLLKRMSRDLSKNFQTAPDQRPLCASKQAIQSKSHFNKCLQVDDPRTSKILIMFVCLHTCSQNQQETVLTETSNNKPTCWILIAIQVLANSTPSKWSLTFCGS